MSTSLPDLDDRRFEDLLEEARAILPGSAPHWTDHNVADPGITLIELFAYLTEIMIYRLNRLSDDNIRRFVKLLRGPGHSFDPALSLSDELRAAVLALRRRERAVTAEDFERLALEAASTRLARACCLPATALQTSSADPLLPGHPAHVSVIVVPNNPGTNSMEVPVAGPELLQTVSNYLEPRRLLTTRVHVLGPRYVPIGVSVDIVPRTDWLETRVRDDVHAALSRYLHPLSGGADGGGWPFGRSVYVSEIYDLLDRLPSVDHITKSTQLRPALDELTVDKADVDRLQRNAEGELVAVRLNPGELVAPTITPNLLNVVKT